MTEHELVARLRLRLEAHCRCGRAACEDCALRAESKRWLERSSLPPLPASVEIETISELGWSLRHEVLSQGATVGIEAFMHRYEDMAAHREWEKRRIAENGFVLESSGVWTMGNPDPSPPSRAIIHDSQFYPQHLFKIGYLRSSWDKRGLDPVLWRLLGHSLYWIFPVAATGAVVQPDWHLSLDRLERVIEEYDRDVPTDPMQDPKAVPGEARWYRQALVILAEWCNWVLSQQDSDKYFLHWMDNP